MSSGVTNALTVAPRLAVSYAIYAGSGLLLYMVGVAAFSLLADLFAEPMWLAVTGWGLLALLAAAGVALTGGLAWDVSRHVAVELHAAGLAGQRLVAFLGGAPLVAGALFSAVIWWVSGGGDTDLLADLRADHRPAGVEALTVWAGLAAATGLAASVVYAVAVAVICSLSGRPSPPTGVDSTHRPGAVM